MKKDKRQIIWDIDTIEITGRDWAGKIPIPEKNQFRFKLVKTCSMCPCQYDIFLRGKKYYGRLRWGWFYVAKSPHDKPIYEYRFKEEKGSFSSPQEEVEFLCKAMRKIIEKEKT